MRSYPIGEQNVTGTYARVMSSDEYRSLETSGILGSDKTNSGKTDYVSTFSITDIYALGRTTREIRERSRTIGVAHPDVLAVFSVKDAKAVYGPRQRIGGREVKIKAGTPANLLDKIRCR